MFAGGLDVLGSGRVARHVARLLGRSHPHLPVRLVSPHRGIDPAALGRGHGPLVIATSVDEARWLARLPAGARSREALAAPNLAHVLDHLPPGALAGRLVLVVTNPVEPIVDALARLEPTARVVGFGLAVDRARFVEVLRHSRDAVCGVAGTHAGGAIPVYRGRALRPDAVVARLRGHRSPFASRALDDAALDALLDATERAPLRDRDRVLVDGAAYVLCAAEHVGRRPPALRGAAMLAQAIRALLGGRPILGSTLAGPCELRA